MTKLEKIREYLHTQNLVDEYGFILDGVTVGQIVDALVLHGYIVTFADSGVIVDEYSAQHENLFGFDEQADFGRIPEHPEKPWGAEHVGVENMTPVEALYGDMDEPYYIVWEEV